jgi:hypothetical protein
MEGLRHPVGELPPDVYWRRRVTILAFAVLAILVIFFLLKAAFASDDQTTKPGPSSTSSGIPSGLPSASPNSSVSTSPGDIRACGTGDLSIDLAPTTRDFAGPALPSFNATVTQTGLTSCVVDTTATGSELLVTSGSDRIWSSKDCLSGALPLQQVVLAPDESRVIQVNWSRIRSNESCAANLPSPRAGTYHAVLTLAGVDSSTTTFTLSD